MPKKSMKDVKEVKEVKVKKSKGRKTNPQLAHVKKFRSKHKGMKYSEILKAARKTYKKK